MDEPAYPRSIRRRLKLALTDTPVVALLGPRQSGTSGKAEKGAWSFYIYNVENQFDRDLIKRMTPLIAETNSNAASLIAPAMISRLARLYTAINQSSPRSA